MKKKIVKNAWVNNQMKEWVGIGYTFTKLNVNERWDSCAINYDASLWVVVNMMYVVRNYNNVMDHLKRRNPSNGRDQSNQNQRTHHQVATTIVMDPMQGPHIIMRRRRSRGNIEDLRHQAKTVLVGVAILTSLQPAPIISSPFFSRSLYKFGTCSPHSLPTLIEPTNTSKNSC